VRLADGEVNLIGGILGDTESKSLSGYPGLLKIPILRYLFGQETKQRQQNEVVFAIIPHIIRSTEVTDENLKMVDLGTGNNVTYRKAETKPESADTSPAQPAQPLVPKPAVAVPPPTGTSQAKPKRYAPAPVDNSLSKPKLVEPATPDPSLVKPAELKQPAPVVWPPQETGG